MLAITQEAGFEFIRTDDGMLTPLKKGDSVFSHDQSENLWEMSKHDPADLFSGARLISSPTPASGENNNVIMVDVGDIVVNGVQDANSFANEVTHILKNSIKNNRNVQNLLNENTKNMLDSKHNSLSVNRW